MGGRRGEDDVRQALALGGRCLAKEGLDTPHLDAELLLAHVLGLTRTQLYAQLQRPLSRDEVSLYEALLQRHRRREPVAYILGRKEFYGRAFLVDQRVLIPRPETELLVEQAVTLARTHGYQLIADIGTGSGCIAISLALEFPRAWVYSTDCSPGTLEVAAANCHHHQAQERVKLLQGDLLEALPEAVDMIVSNLPYVPREVLHQLPREVAEYEPREALDGGCGGLEVIGRMLAGAGAWLRPGGALLLEIDAHQGQEASLLARDRFPQARVERYPDYAGLDRVLIVRLIG